MKKYLALSFVLFLVVFLSGCSLGSSSKSQAPASPAKKPSSVLKSADGGRNWEAKNDAAGKVNLDAADVLSLSINPHDGRNIFIGTLKNGILKTEDGGDNWKGAGLQVEKVYGIAFSYDDGRIVYASGVLNGRGKIFKSLDGGTVWNEIYTSPSDGPLVVSLVTDKKNPNMILAGTSDKQLIKSSDAGTSWRSVYGADSPIMKIAIDSADSDVLYISTQKGEFQMSKDGGKNFVSTEDDKVRSVDIVVADPSTGNVIYAAGKSGLFRSGDRGETWEELRTLGNAQSFPVKALAINSANPREIIYGAGQAVYKSVDEGVSWMPSQLVTARNISAIAYDPGNPSIVYLGLRKK